MDIKNKVIDLIYEYYINSPNFNGLNLVDLLNSFEQKDVVVNNIIELIQNNIIALISSEHDVNPHIIRIGFAPINNQIEFLLSRSEYHTICLYPTNKYLESHYVANEEDYKKPFLKMLKLGMPQYKCLFFEWDILLRYYSDPRYKFKFNDYCGEICSTKGIGESSFINLKSIGVGRYNSEDLVIVAFPKDLNNMSISCQNEWSGKLISEQSQCRVLQDFYNNQLHGNWNFPNTVYRAILQEIENINELTNHIWQRNFFKNIYSKESLEDFDILPIPTYKSYNNYVMTLEKIVVSNINELFFDHIKVNRKNENGTMRGSLTCLTDWLDVVNDKVKDEITKPLKKLRNIRQAPAHKIELNDYNKDYFNQQHNLSVEVYNSLNLLRKLINTHPNSKGCTIKYPNAEKYIII